MLTAESLFGLKDIECQTGAIEIFLHGAGVHKEVLQIFPILLRHPVFYSVFISYSHSDLSDVEKVEQHLLRAGVSVWRDVRDRVLGAGISEHLQAAIARHDRVLVFCSENSLKSSWVKDEIQYALEAESKTGRKDILIPVFIDDSNWTDRNTGLFANRFGLNIAKERDNPVGWTSEVEALLTHLRTVQRTSTLVDGPTS